MSLFPRQVVSADIYGALLGMVCGMPRFRLLDHQKYSPLSLHNSRPIIGTVRSRGACAGI